MSSSHDSYERYGGSGITVCERWSRYANFLVDMGRCPDGCSIDRVDNTKGYSPENCRWATSKEQIRNRSNTIKISIGGETKPLSEWAELHGISYSTVYQRYKRGEKSPDRLFRQAHKSA
jgi:hypothetical protein